MPEQTDFKAGGELLSRMLDKFCGDGLRGVAEGYDMERLSGVFCDSELVRTCMCLFENDLNVSRAADRLYMHRNTLIYRIGKLKRKTGLDVRVFADAVTFIILYNCFLKGAGNEGK